jgi:A118 family predicted phage portal protein
MFFTRFLDWIKGVFSKMINFTSIKDAIKVDIAINTEMADALQLWSEMYVNKATWIDGTKVVSLNLPAAIAGEIARLTTIEMKVDITGNERAKYLAGQFNNVMRDIRNKVEVGVAKGGIMLKPYPDGKNLAVDWIQADCFYPISFDSNGNITSCVFLDQKQEGDRYYNRLDYHRMTDGGVVVKNMAYKSSTKETIGSPVPLDSVEAWAGLSEEATIQNVDRPLFAYFKYPLANNIDPTSPLGVSCYSRAVEQIRDADELYSNLMWEFESGERALYADVLAFTDDNGKKVLPKTRLYRALNGSGNLDDNPDDLYHEWSPDFREAQIKAGLNDIKREIEFKCGLAYGTLSDPETVDKTATELKISRQRSYSTVVDTQKALKDALDQLLWAMDIYTTLYNLAPAGPTQRTTPLMIL